MLSAGRLHTSAYGEVQRPARVLSHSCVHQKLDKVVSVTSSRGPSRERMLFIRVEIVPDVACEVAVEFKPEGGGGTRFVLLHALLSFGGSTVLTPNFLQ